MRNLAVLILLLIAVGFILLLNSFVINSKALLLISQEFPQIPVKPLHWVSPEPKSEQLELEDGIIIDVKSSHSGVNPAIILAMGVRTNEQDKPVILGFADTLSRLGYVVVWPHSQDLDDDKIGFEEPDTFVRAFNYLKVRRDVDKNRISFLGFSVGSSLAMVAAEDKAISQDIHGFVFFGGYYNLFDYLRLLANPVSWQPHEGALSHAEKVLGFEGLTLDNFEDSRLFKFSPDTDIENFKSQLFILHDRSDSYVPWTESEKLRNAVCDRVSCTYHISDVLEHAQVSKEKFNANMLKEFWGLYSFLYQVFEYL